MKTVSDVYLRQPSTFLSLNLRPLFAVLTCFYYWNFSDIFGHNLVHYLCIKGDL